MKKPSRSDLLLLGLAVAVMAQGAAMVTRWGGPTITPGERLGVGDAIGELVTIDAGGEAVRFAARSTERTLLMVFNSECGHCKAVAPAWRAWLAERPADLNVLAVSSESAEVAAAYAAEMGWNVPVATVTIEEPGDAAHALTSRTPWLFLLDGDGIIRFDSQGSNLDELNAELVRADVRVVSAQDEQ